MSAGDAQREPLCAPPGQPMTAPLAIAALERWGVDVCVSASGEMLLRSKRAGEPVNPAALAIAIKYAPHILALAGEFTGPKGWQVDRRG